MAHERYMAFMTSSCTNDQGSTDRKVGPRGPAKFLKTRTGADHGPRNLKKRTND